MTSLSIESTENLTFISDVRPYAEITAFDKETACCKPHIYIYNLLYLFDVDFLHGLLNIFHTWLCGRIHYTSIVCSCEFLGEAPDHLYV